MSNSDKELRIRMITDNIPLAFHLREVFYELLSHDQFDIQPRPDYMMPMQFIGDGIKCNILSQFNYVNIANFSLRMCGHHLR